jgi:Glycosyltransferase family 87
MELSRPHPAVAGDAFGVALTPPDASLVRPTAPVSAPVRARVWIFAFALIATFAKLVVALNTFGTNDVATFYRFAHALANHGLEWTYRNCVPWISNRPLFNHPPLVAYFLKFIFSLQQSRIIADNGITFPFLLRLPGIVADFIVVLLVMKMSMLDERLRLPAWALALFALSPVSLMISGFHGNTDSVMIAFFLAGVYATLKDRTWLSGVFLALGCEVKIVPLLFLPVFVLFWLHRKRLTEFSVSFVVTAAALSWEMLLHVDLLARNVLAYGSYWGLWGITYWLRLTQWPQFGRVTFLRFPPAELAVVTALKLLIIAAIVMIAWRRRKLDTSSLVHSLGWGFVIFFIFSPGVCAQYLGWLAPFVLFLSPRFYAWLTATSALFLFFFYNITANGLPWYMAVSTTKLNTVWTPWSIWPWAALIIGALLLWRNARQRDPALRLFSLAAVPVTDSSDAN